LEELAYLIILGWTVPLAFGGVYLIMDKVVEKIKVKLGAVKVTRLTRSFKMRDQLSVPAGGKIKVGRNSLPFDNKPGFIGFKGSTPVTFYNDLGRQVNMKTPEETAVVDPDYYSNLITEAYNLGIVSSMKKDPFIAILVIGAIIAAGAAAALGILNFQTLQELATKAIVK